MNQSKSGYVLILTLMALALITAIVTKMFYQSGAYLPLTSVFIKRERAKMLALGGVQMALSRLNGSKDQPAVVEDKTATKEEPKKSVQVKLLERILPAINRFQTFKLYEEIDGVSGEINICLACENGKINLNHFYDFENHSFKDVKNKENVNKKENKKDDSGKDKGVELKQPSESEQFVRILCEQLGKTTHQKINPEKVFDGLIKFLSERQYQLLDVTELLKIPEFSYFNKHVFVAPLNTNNQNPEVSSNPIYLTDLFTTWTDDVKVEPWLLTDSLLAILGFPRVQLNDIIKRDSMVADWMKFFKDSSNWQTDWDKSLGVVYGVSVFEIAKPLISMFDTKFNPLVFSVLSYGTVGEITQKVYAIIKLQPSGNNNSSFVVEKLYWI